MHCAQNVLPSCHCPKLGELLTLKVGTLRVQVWYIIPFVFLVFLGGLFAPFFVPSSDSLPTVSDLVVFICMGFTC